MDNKNKSRKSLRFLAYIGILLTIFFMGLTGYAVITNDNNINIDKPEKPLDKDIKVTYNDTSNVTMVNGGVGQRIIKTFVIENTGNDKSSYNILLEDLVNNFADREDLVYTLKNDTTGAYVKETTVPNEEKAIASNVEINSGEKHTYVMTITFKKTNEDQSDNLNKTFSSNINVSTGELSHESGTLLDKIISSSNNLNETNINFNKPEPNPGIYYTNSSINGGRVYFYRGNNTLNNNVIFANMCFKIIRTTEDNGVRIIYNGIPVNNTCPNITDDTAFINKEISYNINNQYNAYVGFMYGTPSSQTYRDEHSNISSSNVKKELDYWYTLNLSEYKNYIQDSMYCNNRKTSKYTYKNIVYGISGYGKTNTGYQTKKRNLAVTNPSYNCENKDDIFTVSNEIGNKKLSNPIGLITADELYYAGYISTTDTDTYLYNDKAYWTMTPAYFNGSYAYNYAVSGKKLVSKTVDTKLGLRPVITLNQNAKILSGDGSNDLPYIITEVKE